MSKCHPKCQIDEPNSVQSPRTVLGPRNGVQVQVDAETVFTRPFKDAKDISANERSALFPRCRLETRPLFDTHFQQTLGKKGSPGQTSIAQYGMGKRIQFNPAPAISAKSCSVYK
jgi:hypothetical protein